MATVFGTGEESAIAAWGKTMIAKGQKAAAEKAAALAAQKTAAEAAGTPLPEDSGTAVKLSDEAKAKAATDDWYKRSREAIREKARIANAQWDHAVSFKGTDDPSSIYAKFGSASAAEKEAYVQRRLISFDETQALHASIYYCSSCSSFCVRKTML